MEDFSKILGQSFQDLLPVLKFKEFQERLGEDTRDDEEYYSPLYPDFNNFNYVHDTSKIEPVYLNDFDFKLESDREALANLIRMDFNADTFETVAKCQCPSDQNPLIGNYLIGSGRKCPQCGSEVERILDIDLNTKVWLKRPTGVLSFINPAFYRTFLMPISTSSPKIEIISFIIDPVYRRQCGIKYPPKSKELKEELHKVMSRLNLNEFILNVDNILTHFLIGSGRTMTSLKNSVAEMILTGCSVYRDVMFCDYIPVPNKITTIIEKYGNQKRVTSNQLRKDSTYMNIADTRSTTEEYTATEHDIEESLRRVGRGIIKLAQQGAEELKANSFPKKGANRKLIASGSLPMTGRSIITSVTGIHNPGQAHIPWIMGIVQLEKQIISHLYRRGYSPSKASALILEGYHHRVPVIDEFFRYYEERDEIVGKLGRMPSIQYLSRRSFFLRIKRDLDDQSIGLPILACSAYNSDQ